MDRAAAVVAGGLVSRDVAGGAERAQAAGLRCRPIAETVADVWAWLRGGGESELDAWRSEHRPPPMEKAREEALLGTDATLL